MKTADELTALTLDFLGEHTNEAMAAMVLGVFWHLIWERPKHLQKLAETNESVPETIKGPKKLRGHVKKELQLVMSQNEELERMVQDLQSQIEGMKRSWSPSPPGAYVPLGMHQNTLRTRRPGLISATIGMTTNELDALISCWALLVFGFCLVAKRRTRRRFNPLSTTVVTLEKASYVANTYFQEEILPVLIKIWNYLAKEFNAWYSRTIDPESDSGQAIARTREYIETHTEKLQEVVHEKVLPISKQLTQQGIDCTRRLADAVATFEMPTWNERPPTILLSDHDEKVKALETSLEQNEAQRKALEEKVTGYEQALKGKEILLYEERMKTRSAKKQAAKVTIEREETRRQETRNTIESARAAVANDQKTVLRNFLSQHLQSRQQMVELQRIDEKNGPKKSAIVLPDPILQGFASAMYLDNLSDLSSEPASSSGHRDCRDEDNYYGNANESRLIEIREQYLRSKTTASSLVPSPIDPLNTGNKTSTGSLLWSAANPATIAKESTTKKYFSTRAAAASQEPSSWMEDPASLMCDWRTNGNVEEMRE